MQELNFEREIAFLFEVRSSSILALDSLPSIFVLAFSGKLCFFRRRECSCISSTFFTFFLEPACDALGRAVF